MRRISAVIAAASLATGSLATGAIAADADRGKDSYFNRPGATLDAMLAEVAACRTKAEGADSRIDGIPCSPPPLPPSSAGRPPTAG